MSIGKIVGQITLVKQSNNAIIKTLKATKGLITDDAITITNLGDDISEWASAQTPSGQGYSDKWLLNGLSQSVIMFSFFQYGSGSTYKIYSAFFGNSSMTSNSNAQIERRFIPFTTEFSTAYYNHADLFRGYGLYIVYDDSHNPDRPRYALVSLPCLALGGVTTPYTAVPQTLVNRHRGWSGYKSGDLYIPSQEQKDYYWSGIYENYAGTDYDPSKAKEQEIYGFPYAPDGSGESKDDGGQGDMVDTSTPIVIDDPRTLFLGNLFRVYKLSYTELSELSNFLLSADFLDNIKKLFSDPMDYLISLCAMPTGAFTGTSSTIQIGNVGTQISATMLSNLFVDIDCGAVSIPAYFDAFLDYAPYTSINLFLVGVGIVPLNVDMFVRQSVRVKYRVDALTGQCLVFVSNDEGLISTHTGNLAYHIPLRSRDYSEMFSGVMSTGVGVMTGNAIGVGTGALEIARGVYKPHIVQGGSFGGNTSIMLNKKCYLIIERPHISVPAKYGTTKGYKSKIYATLGNLHGFTVVEDIHLEHVTASDEEKAELETLLKNGVIL